MRLYSSLYTGRESLISHGTAINAVADNLANSNTPGFKATRPEFSNILAEGLGNISTMPSPTTGNGVMVDNLSSDFTTGSIDFTDRELDWTIEGRGFFMLSDGSDTLYSRAGNFIVDAEGNIVSQSGDNVLGFTEESPEAPVPLSIGDLGTQAAASSAVSLTGNLDNGSPLVAAVDNPASYIELSGASSFSSGIRVVDSLGTQQDIVFHFFHTDVSTWEAQAYVDGSQVGGEAGTPVLLGTGEITFGTDGAQADPGLTLNLTPAYSNGAAAGAVAVDLSGLTGFAQASGLGSASVDGLRAGTVTGFEVSDQGNLEAVFDNGQRVVVGSVALADFVSLEGLQRQGSNNFRETQDSGEPLVGRPKTGTLGGLRSGALELSNTDIANEFVDLIRYQRGYQAGTQVISTADELLNTTIQIA